MQDVQIEKQQLLDILRENRAKHKEIYEEAVEKYHIALEEKLDEGVRDLRAHNGGTPFKFQIKLPVPEEHLSEYDGAIRMVELDVRDNITLEDFEFQQYVLDQWSWMGRFAANTTSYTG